MRSLLVGFKDSALFSLCLQRVSGRACCARPSHHKAESLLLQRLLCFTCVCIVCVAHKTQLAAASFRNAHFCCHSVVLIHTHLGIEVTSDDMHECSGNCSHDLCQGLDVFCYVSCVQILAWRLVDASKEDWFLPIRSGEFPGSCCDLFLLPGSGFVGRDLRVGWQQEGHIASLEFGCVHVRVWCLSIVCP
jgi:hypothetical protein